MHALAKLHLAVLLFGIAGVLGKFIPESAELITLGRTTFGALALTCVLASRKNSFLPKTSKELVILIALGMLLAFHWTAFFRSIQLSSVALGILSFSSFPIFVVFLEPLLKRKKVRGQNLLAAAMTFLGVVLVVPQWNSADLVFQGIVWGVLSGASFAVLALANEWILRRNPAALVAFHENLFAALTLCCFVEPGSALHISASSLFWIVVLGVFCTGLAHTLFIASLEKVEVAVASIVTTLEPVYGILFGFLMLHEVPTSETFVGGSLIIGSTVWLSLSQISKR